MSMDATTMHATPTSATTPANNVSSVADTPVLKVSGVRAVVFSAIAVAIGCGVTAWIARGRYEKFTGYLQARTHTITSDREVRVLEILTPQGKSITSGTPLVKLENTQLPEQIRKQQQLIQDLTDKVSETEAQVQLAVERERNSIKREILNVNLRAAEYEKQRFEKDLAEIAWEDGQEKTKGIEALNVSAENDLERLPKPLVIPDDQFDERIRNKLRRKKSENAKEILQVSIDMCNKHLAELKQKLTELPETVRKSMGLHRVQLALENAKTELTSLEQQQQSLTINSPGTGIVGVYRKTVGTHVPAHEAIVEVLDEDQPHLLLQVPSNRVADFTAGTILDLRFPGGKSGQGKVANVPPQTVNAPGLAVAETQMAVEIVPYGILWPKLPINTMVEIRRPR